MLRKYAISAAMALAVGVLGAGGALAQESVKIGLIVPMTGQQASTGKQIDAAVRLYMQQHGTTVAGKKIEVILKDDAAVPDNTKRLAQELIVNDKVAVIAGFGVTPAALAAAPLATRSQGGRTRHGGRHLDHHRALALHRAHQLHAAAVVRDHRRLGGQERHQEGRDPGLRLCAGRRRARSPSTTRFKAAGGQVVEAIKVPLANPDFAPFLQRAARCASPTPSSCSSRPARAAPS